MFVPFFPFFCAICFVFVVHRSRSANCDAFGAFRQEENSTFLVEQSSFKIWYLLPCQRASTYYILCFAYSQHLILGNQFFVPKCVFYIISATLHTRQTEKSGQVKRLPVKPKKARRYWVFQQKRACDLMVIQLT